MTKWRVVAFYCVQPDRMDRRKTEGLSTALPRRAGTGGMTISFKFDDPGDKSIKSQTLRMTFLRELEVQQTASSRISVICQQFECACIITAGYEGCNLTPALDALDFSAIHTDA